MSIAATTPALDRFLDESRLHPRLEIMRLWHEEMARPAATFEPVLKALDRDATVAALVRHAACSAYFGGNNTHCSLAEALARMGIREFHRCVATAVLHAQAGSGTLPGFCTHSDEIARLCEFQAAQCSPTLTVEAYFAGLYHDFAMPAMTDTLTDYQYFVEQAQGNDPGVLELEKECHGFTHCEAGAELIKVMRFPPAVVFAARHHHEPRRLTEASGDEARLLAMVVIAEGVVAVNAGQAAAVFSESGDGNGELAACKALGLDHERFQVLTGELLEHCRLRRAA